VLTEPGLLHGRFQNADRFTVTFGGQADITCTIKKTGGWSNRTAPLAIPSKGGYLLLGILKNDVRP
jgi:hypothetical protein